MKRTNIGLALLAILPLTLPAQRPEDRRKPHGTLAETLDQDHDGELSAQEINAAPQRLRALDRDMNGILEEKEILRKREDSEFNSEEFIDRVFKHDLNGDNRVSREELPKGFVRLIEQADSDKDDALSKAELETTVKRLLDRNRGH